MKRDGETGRLERLHVPTGDACNNMCAFCMEYPRRSGVVPDDATARRQLDENLAAGAVIFSHGEPTLNPDLPARVKYAHDAGYETVCIVSNGRRLADPALCRTLLENGANEVTISIHGHTSDIHDALTGITDSFDQTWRAVQNFCELRREFEFRLFLSTVLNKINLPALDRMLAAFIRLDINQSTLKPPRIEGRALENFGRIVPSPAEFSAAFKSAVDVLSKSNSIHRLVSLIHITGTPLCLLRGYEMFAGAQEVVLGLAKYGAETVRVESMTDNIKREECGECAYGPVCAGADREYVARFGWDAFVPATEYSREFRDYADRNDAARAVSDSRPRLSPEEKQKLTDEIGGIVIRLRSEASLSLNEKADLCFEVGTRKLLLGDPSGALDYLTYTISTAPNHGGAHVKMVRALIELGRDNEARATAAAARNCSLDPVSEEELNQYLIMFK